MVEQVGPRGSGKCTACQGKGRLGGAGCPMCNGSGNCPRCKGTGRAPGNAPDRAKCGYCWEIPAKRTF